MLVHRPSRVAAALLLAVAVLSLCATPPAAEAATATSHRRQHDKRARLPQTAVEQATAAAADDDGDYDNGVANYDEYEDNGDYHRKPPPTTTASAADVEPDAGETRAFPKILVCKSPPKKSVWENGRGAAVTADPANRSPTVYRSQHVFKRENARGAIDGLRRPKYSTT